MHFLPLGCGPNLQIYFETEVGFYWILKYLSGYIIALEISWPNVIQLYIIWESYHVDDSCAIVGLLVNCRT